MSIKIYNGYKLYLKDMNIDTLINWINDKKKELSKIQDKYITSSITESFYENLDSPEEQEDIQANDALSFTMNEFINEYNNEMKTFECGLASASNIYMSFIPAGTIYYIIVSNNKKEILEVFDNDKSIVNYSYWNNTDAPENISEEEWMMRGEVWQSVLQNYIGIDQIGVSLHITKHPKDVEVKKIISEIGKYSSVKRIEDASKNLYITEELKKENSIKVVFSSNKKWKKFNNNEKELYRDKVLPLKSINIQLSEIKINRSAEREFLCRELETYNNLINVIDINREMSHQRNNVIKLVKDNNLKLASNMYHEIFFFIENYQLKIGIMVNKDSELEQLFKFKSMKSISPVVYKNISRFDYRKESME